MESMPKTMEIYLVSLLPPRVSSSKGLMSTIRRLRWYPGCIACIGNHGTLTSGWLMVAAPTCPTMAVWSTQGLEFHRGHEGYMYSKVCCPSPCVSMHYKILLTRSTFGKINMALQSSQEWASSVCKTLLTLYLLSP